MVIFASGFSLVESSRRIAFEFSTFNFWEIGFWSLTRAQYLNFILKNLQIWKLQKILTLIKNIFEGFFASGSVSRESSRRIAFQFSTFNCWEIEFWSVICLQYLTFMLKNLQIWKLKKFLILINNIFDGYFASGLSRWVESTYSFWIFDV